MHKRTIHIDLELDDASAARPTEIALVISPDAPPTTAASVRVSGQTVRVRPPEPRNVLEGRVGQWQEAEGWKLRIAEMDERLAPVADRVAPWTAPEIDVSTPAGGGVRRISKILSSEPGAQVLIGRSRKADVVLEDEYVSRTHVRVYAKDGRQMVEDLGGRWCMRLNGMQTRGPVRLQHGDILYVGKTRIEYSCYKDVVLGESSTDRVIPPAASPAPKLAQPRGPSQASLDAPTLDPDRSSEPDSAPESDALPDTERPWLIPILLVIVTLALFVVVLFFFLYG